MMGRGRWRCRSGRRWCSDERRSKRHAIVAKDGPVHMICRKTRRREKQQKAVANSCLQRRWKASVDEKPILKFRSPASQQARERGTRVTSTRATTSECATTSDECAAQSFARALRAYHGTLSPRWGPTSDQCEIVRARAARLPWNARPPVGLSPTSSGSVPAPSSRPIQERAASCSSPPAQPPRCGATARSEKINLAVGQKSTSR